ncbi:MAG: Fe-S cluster assembly ATPase SufC [Candidatus Peregrinibacteria bacterium]
MRPPLLSLSSFSVSASSKEIIHALDLTIKEGEVHAIMGPNGSGKSTLVTALMGHPSLTITATKATFRGKNLLTLAAHERAEAGLFLAFQHPREIGGVSLRSFLYAAFSAQMKARSPKKQLFSPIVFAELLEKKMKLLHMDPALAERAVNVGFSGGEKKKAEALQLLILEPRLSLLDETDSGLDLDALRIVAENLKILRTSRAKNQPPFSAIIVTHHAHILDFLKPDRVHVMVKGRIVKSGGRELVKKLEKEGYAKFKMENV